MSEFNRGGSEVKEVSPANKCGDASEETKEVAMKQANESGGFKDKVKSIIGLMAVGTGLMRPILLKEQTKETGTDSVLVAENNDENKKTNYDLDALQRGFTNNYDGTIYRVSFDDDKSILDDYKKEPLSTFEGVVKLSEIVTEVLEEVYDPISKEKKDEWERDMRASFEINNKLVVNTAGDFEDESKNEDDDCYGIGFED